MSRATELAEQCGAIVGRGFLDCSVLVFKLTESELEAFYHAARAEMAREAANLCNNEHGTAGDAGAKIRAMADREGK